MLLLQQRALLLVTRIDGHDGPVTVVQTVTVEVGRHVGHGEGLLQTSSGCSGAGDDTAVVMIATTTTESTAAADAGRFEPLAVQPLVGARRLDPMQGRIGRQLASHGIHSGGRAVLCLFAIFMLLFLDRGVLLEDTFDLFPFVIALDLERIVARGSIVIIIVAIAAVAGDLVGVEETLRSRALHVREVAASAVFSLSVGLGGSEGG